MFDHVSSQTAQQQTKQKQPNGVLLQGSAKLKKQHDSPPPPL